MGRTTPPGTSEDLPSLVNSHVVRQSPPPVTNGRSMPSGAIISPPDSTTSSGDEEEQDQGRHLDKLRELQEVISQIPQNRSLSPPPIPPPMGDREQAVIPSSDGGLPEGMHHSFSTGSLSGLSSSARKISHSRSNTEPKIVYPQSPDVSLTASEEDSDGEPRRKPIMVRKKSGELVRPALRAPSRRRPSSMPGTPTFSKAVHFDQHLEHVRHFLQVDRPAAVSAGSSPVDNYDTDDEFPFHSEPPRSRSPPYEWELVVNHFPAETPIRKALPVRMERVWLSTDQKTMLGSVVVANLAFHKSVTCRFTLDNWKTTSEVSAEYTSEVRPKQSFQGHDRFTFSIKLSDTAHLEAKTLYFCIKYSVDGAEYWDNNNHSNFQIAFRKKMLPQNGKRGLQGAGSRPANSLPRSRSASPRAKAANSGSLDEFRRDDNLDKDLTVRLKGVKSTTSLPSDNLSNGLSSPSGQAFSNRYDFGASLSAARQAAKDNLKQDRDVDGLYMKANKRGEASALNAAKPRSPVNGNFIGSSPAPKPSIPGITSTGSSSLSSSSYEELVNKYCFYGSKQSSPQMKDGTISTPQNPSENESQSPMNGWGPGDNTKAKHHEPTAQHHSLHPGSSEAYFYRGPVLLNTPVPTEQPSGRSGSPALLANSHYPLAGTSRENAYSHLSERFPFGTETHAATAIRS